MTDPYPLGAAFDQAIRAAEARGFKRGLADGARSRATPNAAASARALVAVTALPGATEAEVVELAREAWVMVTRAK